MNKVAIWSMRIGILALLLPAVAHAQRNAPPDAPFVLEHSYWLQSGKADDFVELFKRNKLPLLQLEANEGRILWIRMSRPRLRSADGSQPDFRLTIAWRNPSVAFDDVDPSRFVAGLYKDPDKRRREEEEREQMIVKRSDVPVQESTIVGSGPAAAN